MSASRKCKAKTKAGKACRATGIMDNGFCMAHQPAEVRESLGFVADNGKGGRPRVPSPIEMKRKLIEDNVRVMVEPYFKALGYEIVEGEDGELTIQESGEGGVKLTASFQGHVSESEIDDIGAQIEVVEKLLNRVYGKPVQQTELSGEVTTTQKIDLSNLTDKELEQWEALQRKAAGQ